MPDHIILFTGLLCYIIADVIHLWARLTRPSIIYIVKANELFWPSACCWSYITTHIHITSLSWLPGFLMLLVYMTLEEGRGRGGRGICSKHWTDTCCMFQYNTQQVFLHATSKIALLFQLKHGHHWCRMCHGRNYQVCWYLYSRLRSYETNIHWMFTWY